MSSGGITIAMEKVLTKEAGIEMKHNCGKILHQ